MEKRCFTLLPGSKRDSERDLRSDKNDTRLKAPKSKGPYPLMISQNIPLITGITRNRKNSQRKRFDSPKGRTSAYLKSPSFIGSKNDIVYTQSDTKRNLSIMYWKYPLVLIQFFPAYTHYRSYYYFLTLLPCQLLIRQDISGRLKGVRH